MSRRRHRREYGTVTRRLGEKKINKHHIVRHSRDWGSFWFYAVVIAGIGGVLAIAGGILTAIGYGVLALIKVIH